MRFARQATLFRGPLDSAPVVSVLFLLVIFVLLGSLVYTPGVTVKFEEGAHPNGPVITVAESGDILFDGQTNKVSELEQLRARVGKFGAEGMITINPLPGADPKIVERVAEMFQIVLPANDAKNLTSTDNPTVIVAVNFRGQCFFENQLMTEKDLRHALRARLQDASRESKKLTMVLWADKATANEVVMRLYQLGRDVGITEFLLAERPNPFAASVKPS